MNALKPMLGFSTILAMGLGTMSRGVDAQDAPSAGQVPPRSAQETPAPAAALPAPIPADGAMFFLPIPLPFLPFHPFRVGAPEPRAAPEPRSLNIWPAFPTPKDFGLPGLDELVQPPFQIQENAETMSLVVRLPGVRVTDAEVRIQGRTLTLDGHCEPRPGFAGVAPASITGSGRFGMTLALPAAAVAESTRWSIEDGLLHITVSKRID